LNLGATTALLIVVVTSWVVPVIEIATAEHRLPLAFGQTVKSHLDPEGVIDVFAGSEIEKVPVELREIGPTLKGMTPCVHTWAL
jgi:hypothetical protein